MNTEKKLGILALVVVVIVIAGIALRPVVQDRTISATVDERIERPELNFSFVFPSGEDAYSYIEPAFGTSSTEGTPIAAFIMIENDAYIAFQDPSFVGETPPSMSIFVYKKVKESTTTVVASDTPRVGRVEELQNWAQSNSGLTSYALAVGAPEEVSLDGATAIHYTADGLYQQDIYLAFYKGNYYLIVGQFNAPTDTIYADFQNLVQSISFI